MKRSNKILLGGFLFVILLITGIHLTLYAKYKNGDYTIYQPGSKGQQVAMQSFPAISVVSIHNSGVVIEFGEVLAVEKGREGVFRYEQKGDSLVVDAVNNDGRLTDHRQLRLIIPYNAMLKVFNSNLSIERSQAEAGVNPDISLTNSNLFFTHSQKPVHFDLLKVSLSDHSRAVFNDRAGVGRFDIALANSSFEYAGGNVGELSIATDSSSQLILDSRHLLKAKITSLTSSP